jgi:hypothetical protein
MHVYLLSAINPQIQLTLGLDTNLYKNL